MMGKGYDICGLFGRQIRLFQPSLSNLIFNKNIIIQNIWHLHVSINLNVPSKAVSLVANHYYDYH